MTIRAKWLRLPEDVYGAYTQSRFSLPTVLPGERVSLRIVGLGYYRVYLNGYALSQELYSQPFSDYCPRDLRNTLHFTENVRHHTIYYNEYDITLLVTPPGGQRNDNLLFCELGCGWFKNNDRTCEGDFSFSKHLMLAFEISVGDRVVFCSDERTLWRENGIVYEGLYSGMVFDFKREPMPWGQLVNDLRSWYAPEITEAPESVLKKNLCRGDRILRRMTPKPIIRTKEYTVYDCGVNTVGYLAFRAAKEQGEISVEYAELCGKNDIIGIYETIVGFKQSQIDRYRNVPLGGECAPRFTWYGFRYVKVRGDITDPEVVMIGTQLTEKTSFSSSDPVLNWYEAAARNSMKTNLHMSVPTDCPHREKYPYTGDGRLVAGAMMLNYGVREEYEKWLWDMEDAQTSAGMIPNTVPYEGGGGGPGAWGSACVLLPWKLYNAYGETSVLSDHVTMMERYLDAMIAMTKSGVVTREGGGRPFLGDWSYPDGNTLPCEFVNTYYLVKAIQTYEKICTALGRQMPGKYRDTVSRVTATLTKEWFDPATGSYLQGKHGADAFALDIGLGDDRTKRNLIEKYTKQKCFDTGVFGTEILISVLEELGAFHVIYRLLSTSKYPSFGYWRRQGATSLWEDWSGCFATAPGETSSRNHAMFAAVQPYLFSALGGVRKDASGVTVTPRRVPGLRRITAQVYDHDGHLVTVTTENFRFSSRVFVRADGPYKLVVDGKEVLCKGNTTIKIGHQVTRANHVKLAGGAYSEICGSDLPDTAKA